MAERFVVDCSVAAEWVLPEPGREAALAIYDRYAAGSIELIAPDLLLAEFASLLARRCRRKQISHTQGREAFRLMTLCAPELVETRSRVAEALDFSLRFHLSLRDSIYLAVAREFDCPVLTADARLVRAARGAETTVHLVR
ncbi:MAG TPA: type II toxin-antitoxin system VapC family toxin [Bryobacteraceae bacterium]|nr:type II toxin-antitoxin system VapC family toxin [Bryobacteraceae bacterium]